MRTRRSAFAVTAAAVLALAACGGGQDDGNDGVASAGGGAAKGATATPSQSLDPRDAQLKFAQCMRQNGVDVPDPGGDAGQFRIQAKGADRGKLEAAMEKCQSYLQAGGKMPDMKDPKVRDAYVKYAQCMRQNGIDMPDPDANGGLRIRGGPGKMDEAKLKKAQAACKNLLPGGGARK